MTGIDTRRAAADLAPWLDGLDPAHHAEGERLLAEVVTDWAREADPTPDPQAVLAIQRERLEAAGRGRDADGRLAVLRAHTLTSVSGATASPMLLPPRPTRVTYNASPG